MSEDEVDDILKLDNQLCFPLYAASRLVVQAYGPYLKKLGLTYPQYLVLMILWESDGKSVQEIGALLYLDSGTLSPLLKRMADAGFIERRKGAADERIVENWLTEKSKNIKGEAAMIPVQLLCSMGMQMEELIPTRDGLKALLGRLWTTMNGASS